MSTRIHIVVSDELLAAVDGVRGDVPRSAWLRRTIERHVAEVEAHRRPGPYVSDAEVEFRAEERAVEQALGSPGSPDAVAGVRGRVPAPVPAEQPPDTRAMDLLREDDPDPEFVARGRVPELPASGYSRVRSSAAARPFRPAPKKGEK